MYSLTHGPISLSFPSCIKENCFSPLGDVWSLVCLRPVVMWGWTAERLCWCLGCLHHVLPPLRGESGTKGHQNIPWYTVGHKPDCTSGNKQGHVRTEEFLCVCMHMNKYRCVFAHYESSPLDGTRVLDTKTWHPSFWSAFTFTIYNTGTDKAASWHNIWEVGCLIQLS